ncbi:hypothetical protein JANLI_04010 [Janthinobacterium lividum]|nr:hypothetical protein JANLI_04010 [Janthinobacterium lividum]
MRRGGNRWPAAAAPAPPPGARARTAPAAGRAAPPAWRCAHRAMHGTAHRGAAPAPGPRAGFHRPRTAFPGTRSCWRNPPRYDASTPSDKTAVRRHRGRLTAAHARAHRVRAQMAGRPGGPGRPARRPRLGPAWSRRQSPRPAPRGAACAARPRLPHTRSPALHSFAAHAGRPGAAAPRRRGRPVRRQTPYCRRGCPAPSCRTSTGRAGRGSAPVRQRGIRQASRRRGHSCAASAIATTILRAPLKVERPCAASILSSISTSPSTHGNITVHASRTPRISCSADSSIGEPSP